MKYLRLTHAVTGDTLLVSGFGLDLMHADLAAPYQAKGYTVTAAGFYHFEENGSVTVHGHSHGLNIGPQPDDAQFIERLNEVQRRVYVSAAAHAPAA